jgi:hypothetical protein
MYCNISEAYNNKPKTPMFSAQGDLSCDNNDKNIGGTSLSEIRKKIYQELDYDQNQENNQLNQLDQLDQDQQDSIFDDFSSFNVDLDKKKSTKINHNKYINQFTKYFLDTDNESTLDTKSTLDNRSFCSPDTFNHVNSCKYCRYRIKKILKNTNKNNNKNNYEFFQELNKNQDHEQDQEKKLIGGYKIEELVIIGIIGLIVIFLLDFFVKIGRST